ncbi:MAG: hypothetical protein SFV81_03080 [Pirellulaceae bacterium]|nr:hypothetical protein [Pirellulaceae bacterium]
MMNYLSLSSPSPNLSKCSSEGAPQSYAGAGVRKHGDKGACGTLHYGARLGITQCPTLILGLCLFFASPSNFLTSTASAWPSTFQADDETLDALLVKYNSRVQAVGRNHPSAVDLRRDIDEKIKAGARCDRDLMTKSLERYRNQYRSTRDELGESHPTVAEVVANIALLTELLANEPDYIVDHVDDLIQLKEKWPTGILYVANGRHTGTVRVEANATLIDVPEGTDNGIKVGMHFYLYVIKSLRQPRTDGENYTLGRVTSVEPKQSVVQFEGKGKLDTRSMVYYSQPGFKLGSLIITVRFDEETWKNRTLMNAFLGDLLHNCSGDELAKLNVLVTDLPRSGCQIDLLPVGPKGHTEEQLRTLKALDSFIKQQHYFKNMKLNSVTSFEKARPAARDADGAEKERLNQRLKEQSRASTEALTPLMRQRVRSFELNSALSNWQENELQGVPPDTLEKTLASLRTRANELEGASLEKANEARRLLAAAMPETSEDTEKIKAELRAAVDEAFNARQKLQLMEFTSLTLQVQTMLRKLNQRSESQAEIVDRRVDDLLNPNYRWDSGTVPLISNGDLEKGLASNRDIGWQINEIDGALEFILQLPKNQAQVVEPGDVKMAIPESLKGRFTRVVVRFGSAELPRSPSIEELKLLPTPDQSSSSTPATTATLEYKLDDDGKFQIVIAIPPAKQWSMKEGNQEYVVNLPGAVAAGASAVLLRLSYAEQVTGLVTFRGKPITGSIEFFVDSAQLSAAKIAETGEFQVALRPGKYKVTINPDSDVAAKVIPSKYKSWSETPIEIDVSTGNSNFQIELSK